MKPTHALAALALAALVPACSENAAPQGGPVIARKAVDDSFVPWRIIWSGGGPGRYEARVALTDIDGRIAVCGVGWLSHATYARVNRSSMRSKFVTYDGNEILRDLSFFASVGSEEALDTATANCALTNMRVTETEGRYLWTSEATAASSG